MLAPYALVIEDDPRIADIFERALEDGGFSTEVLYDAHKAQSYLVFSTPDLVLLDIHLPHMSGEVILRQLSGNSRFDRTCILIVTGDENIQGRFGERVDEVLMKPIGYEDLRARAELMFNEV